MANAARKTRKRIRHAALAAGDTATAEAHAFEKDPKRPTRKYQTKKQLAEQRRDSSLKRAIDRIIPKS